jgi:hypothetical protein
MSKDMSDYKKICANAVGAAEKYLASDLSVDMSAELQEAQRAVSDAWDAAESSKARKVCRTAWHVCLSARTSSRVSFGTDYKAGEQDIIQSVSEYQQEANREAA